MKKYMKPSVLSSTSLLEEPIMSVSLGVNSEILESENDFLGKDRDFFDSDAKDDDPAWSDGLW